MLWYILGTVFSIMGIIGYYTNIPILVTVALIYIVAEAVITLYRGELKNITTYVIAIIIGLSVALYTEADVLLTVGVSLCFESLVVGIISLVFFIIFILKNN